MDTVWAEKSRRRMKWFLLILAALLVSIYFGIKLYKPPTCFDNKRNQGEVGVDCGGVCALLCVSQTQELTVSWAQPFQVSRGWWSVFAYVENPNFSAYAEDVPFRFRVYDSDGGLITERVGKTYITSDPVVPVFVGRIDTGASIPYRVAFEWLERPAWRVYTELYQVSFEEQRFVPATLGQDLQVIAHNQEPFPIRDLRVVAVVYDGDDNAIAVSETYADIIPPRSRRTLTFSWPETLSAQPGRIQFLPRIPAQD
jgi:hypothetical protein